MTREVTATIVVPTFNGQQYLEEALEAVLGQEAGFPFEVLVIDSGSSDRTLEIVRRHPVRLVEIPNEEFGHGRTRNLAVRLARGRYVAFLTQDATPATEAWLAHLVAAFDLDPQVACVYGPHLPRPDADPKTRLGLLDFFAGMGPDDSPTLHGQGDITFFSDVNGCIARSVWEQIPYRDLDYAEDQAFGKDVLEAGFLKVFEPRAAVVHSHQYGPLAHLKRQFDEWVGLRRSIGAVEDRPLWRVFGGAARASVDDGKAIWGDGSLSTPEKLRYIPLASWMNLCRRLAPYLAAREERIPPRVRARLSYESGWKRAPGAHAGVRGEVEQATAIAHSSQPGGSTSARTREK